MSARIQLDDGTVIRRHQDHVRVRESADAAASITSEIPEATPVAISEPVAIFEPDASSANTNSRESATHEHHSLLRNYHLYPSFKTIHRP